MSKGIPTPDKHSGTVRSIYILYCIYHFLLSEGHQIFWGLKGGRDQKA